MSTKSARLSIADLLRVTETDRDITWLKQALQWAIELELSTIGPYLLARWSIVTDAGGAKARLQAIAKDEMNHMGWVSNMLVGIGGQPDMNLAPTYPGPMPGGVHPGVTVTLGGLTELQLRLFMKIEEPETPLPQRSEGEAFATIGVFYDAILSTFQRLQPPISTAAQVPNAGLISTLADVEEKIMRIKDEGEGTTGSPSVGTKLAHHYQFGEILHQKKFVKTETGWDYVGEAVPFPSSVYTLTGVASDAESEDFNGRFTGLMRKFHEAWTTNPAAFNDAVGAMYGLEAPARALMANGKWPSFKFLPETR